ncbi:MAG: MFS transporter [Rhodothermaeota bacterium MED-G12]|nr:MAG: MFS transporter [Rhodothermaeota bacterium MED-G12]
MAELKQYLSKKEKIGYGLGDMASNLYFQTFVVFMPIFYTDVFGLAPAAMGTMMLFSRFWDAANDPLMGMIADRTDTKWGKFRPYIAGFAIPIGLAGFFAFNTPNFGASGNLIYAYVTYILLMMMYTGVNVPYAALMGVITPNSAERTSVSQYRFAFAFIGQFIAGAVTLGLVEYFGSGNEAIGWRMVMVLYGIVAAALLFGTFSLTKERVLPKVSKQNRIKDDLKNLMKNKPWILMGLATFFQLTFIVMRGSSTTYYFRYFVGNQELNLLGMNIDLGYALFTSSFIGVGTVATFIGALLTSRINKYISKKTIYSRFLIMSAICSLLFYFLAPENIILIYTLNALVSFFFGAVSVTQWAMYTDTADYGEWKFGSRSTALIMAASLFALKMGLTAGGTIVGWVLEGYGFVANEIQTESTLLGIKMLMSVFPALFGIIGGFLVLFYPITDEKMVEIELDLKNKG